MTLLAAATSAQAADYTIDPTHSHILFMIDHLGFAKIVGLFSDFSVTLSSSARRVAAVDPIRYSNARLLASQILDFAGTESQLTAHHLFRALRTLAKNWRINPMAAINMSAQGGRSWITKPVARI
jgi:hypothetical protein